MKKAQMKMQIDAMKLKMQLAGEQEKQQMKREAKEMELKYKMVSHALEAQVAAKHQQAMQQSEDNHIMKMMTQKESPQSKGD